MDTKTKKITAVLLVVVLAVIIIISLSLDKKPVSAPTMPEENGNSQMMPQEEATPEEEAMVAAAIPSQENSELASIQGKVSKIDIASVTVKDEKENEATLSFSPEGAQIFKEVEKDDGVTLEEVGLFDIEAGSSVEVQFDTKTREVEFMKVLAE